MDSPQSPLDAIDRRILRLLQQNARLSNAELAQKVGLSVSPVWRRGRALEESGVITGYQALVDRAAAALASTVLIHVSLQKQVEPSLEAFEAAVRRRPEAMECYLMTGDA